MNAKSMEQDNQINFFVIVVMDKTNLFHNTVPNDYEDSIKISTTKPCLIFYPECCMVKLLSKL